MKGLKIVASMEAPNSLPLLSSGEESAPRLSILHLMLWTLCSAVYLTVMRAIHSLQEVPGEYAVIQNTSSVVGGVVAGAVLMGAIVLGYSRYRIGAPLVRHPGHWLLLISASMTLASLTVSLLFFSSGLTSRTTFFLVYGAIHMAEAIAYVFALRHSRPIGWRSLFGALVLLSVLQTLTYLANGFDLYLFPWWGVLNSIPTWGQFLVCGWVVIVSTSDLMAGQRRDWLHWTGVTTYVAYTGMSLFWMIAVRLMQP